MKYHEMPEKWRKELRVYCLEYIRSGFALSIREHARNAGLLQGTCKRYLSPESRDWVLDTLLLTASIKAAELEGGAKISDTPMTDK